MNNKLDLQIFESRCDCLTKVLSSYREGLVILGLYGVKDFNNAYVVEELMEGIISLCEKIYSYLKINKSKTQYKSILGPSSISHLYKNIDNIKDLNDLKINFDRKFKIKNVIRVKFFVFFGKRLYKKS